MNIAIDEITNVFITNNRILFDMNSAIIAEYQIEEQ